VQKYKRVAILILMSLPMGLISKISDGGSFVYMSPGVSMVYTFNQGLTMGAQASIGLVKLAPSGDGFVVLGNPTFPIPAVTFGFKRSTLQKIKFIDLQLFTGIVGVGLGRAKITNRADGIASPYNHLKIWGGPLLLAQYDHYFVKYPFESESTISSLGGSLVLPLPLIQVSKHKPDTP